MTLKDTLRPFVPSSLRSIRKWCIDAKPLVPPFRHMPARHATKMIVAFSNAHQNIRCAHSPQEMSEIACGILRRRNVDGCIVEAGSFKGGGTASYLYWRDISSETSTCSIRLLASLTTRKRTPPTSGATTRSSPQEIGQVVSRR